MDDKFSMKFESVEAKREAIENDLDGESLDEVAEFEVTDDEKADCEIDDDTLADLTLEQSNDNQSILKNDNISRVKRAYVETSLDNLSYSASTSSSVVEDEQKLSPQNCGGNIKNSPKQTLFSTLYSN